MAFSKEETETINKALERYIEKVRPSFEIRDKVDIAYKIYNQSVGIFEKRKLQNNQLIEEPIAKATFMRTSNKWNVYWQRADLKWHGYEPKKQVSTIQDFLRIVEDDEFCCFWG